MLDPSGVLTDIIDKTRQRQNDLHPHNDVEKVDSVQSVVGPRLFHTEDVEQTDKQHDDSVG